jgi:hypothetical protein
MRAVTWNELGAQPALRDDLPEPAPGAGEVLVARAPLQHTVTRNLGGS